ncbi:MAG: hypothetical protein WC602_00680 [archaeon]
MKPKILLGALGLTVLISLVILSSGCVQGFGKTREQQAIDLASSTREASVMLRLQTAFNEVKNCGYPELAREVKAANPGALNPSEVQSTNAKEAIKKGQACLPSMKLVIAETTAHVYDVNYGFAFPETCSAVPEFAEVGKARLEIRVDLDKGTAVVSDNGRQGNQALDEAIKLLSENRGSCSLVLLFPEARWDSNSLAPEPTAGQNNAVPDENKSAIRITGVS